MELHIVEGDLLDQDVEVIVNASNRNNIRHRLGRAWKPILRVEASTIWGHARVNSISIVLRKTICPVDRPRVNAPATLSLWA